MVTRSKKKSSSSASPTGGFSSSSGDSVLVTPSGQVVGSAEDPRVIRTIRGGGGSSSQPQQVQPTQTEQQLQQSLQPEIRNQSALRARQAQEEAARAATGRSTFRPSDVDVAVSRGQNPTLGRVLEVRQERLESVAQQSLPRPRADLGAFEFIPRRERGRVLAASFGAGVKKGALGAGDFFAEGFGTQRQFDKDTGKLQAGRIQQIPLIASQEQITSLREEPGDLIQTGIQIAPIAIGGTSALSTGLRVGRAEGTLAGVSEALGTFAPLRPRPGVFTRPPTKNFELLESDSQVSIRQIDGGQLPGGTKVKFEGFEIPTGPKSGGSIGVGEASFPTVKIGRGGDFNFGQESTLFGGTGVSKSLGNVRKKDIDIFFSDKGGVLKLGNGRDVTLSKVNQFNLLQGRQEFGGSPKFDRFVNLNSPKRDLFFEKINIKSQLDKDVLEIGKLDKDVLEIGKFVDVPGKGNTEFGDILRIRKPKPGDDFLGDQGFSSFKPSGTKSRRPSSKFISDKTTKFISDKTILDVAIPGLPVSKFSPSSSLGPITTKGAGPSIFQGTGLYERTESGVFPEIGSFNAPSRSRSSNVNFQDGILVSRGPKNMLDFSNLDNRGNKINFRPDFSFPTRKGGPITIPVQEPNQIQDFFSEIDFDEEQDLKKITPQRPTPSRFSFDFRGPKQPRTGFLPLLALPGLGFGDNRRRKVKPKKRKFKRTPSLIALEFGITSSGPAIGEITGLVSRPIITKKRKKRKSKRGRR